VAVTSPHGSNGPTVVDWSPLRGRSIDTLIGLVTTGGVELWHDRDRVADLDPRHGSDESLAALDKAGLGACRSRRRGSPQAQFATRIL
jgi:hypothetical protein